MRETLTHRKNKKRNVRKTFILEVSARIHMWNRSEIVLMIIFWNSRLEILSLSLNSFISDYLLILLCDGSQSRVEESKSRVAHCLCCLPNCIALHSLILFHCIASVATAGCMCMEMVGRLIKVEFPLQLKGWGGEGK